MEFFSYCRVAVTLCASKSAAISVVPLCRWGDHTRTAHTAVPAVMLLLTLLIVPLFRSEFVRGESEHEVIEREGKDEREEEGDCEGEEDREVGEEVRLEDEDVGVARVFSSDFR